MKLCFATNNKNKLSEIQSLLGAEFEILSLSDIGCHEELPENQTTIEGNSQEKTEYVFKKYNVPCFGDDTGLEIEALNGEPGVYSARYAGPDCDSVDNMNLVLEKMQGKTNRQAQFRTVVSLYGCGELQQFEGIVKGTLRSEKSGNDGFGYDPIFEPEGKSVTFAEMSMSEKNAISHRGQAIRKLVEFLKK